MKYMKIKMKYKILLIVYILILIAIPLNIISTSFALRNYDSINKEKPNPSNTFIITLNGKKYLAEYMTREKVEEMKKQSVLRATNKNYNQIIDGHGTGYAPPTPEELEKLIGKISLIDIISEASFLNYRAAADISTEIYLTGFYQLIKFVYSLKERSEMVGSMSMAGSVVGGMVRGTSESTHNLYKRNICFSPIAGGGRLK